MAKIIKPRAQDLLDKALLDRGLTPGTKAKKKLLKKKAKK